MQRGLMFVAAVTVAFPALAVEPKLQTPEPLAGSAPRVSVEPVTPHAEPGPHARPGSTFQSITPSAGPRTETPPAARRTNSRTAARTPATTTPNDTASAISRADRPSAADRPAEPPASAVPESRPAQSAPATPARSVPATPAAPPPETRRATRASTPLSTRAPKTAGKQTTICGMTINSQDEVKAFIQRLQANRPGSKFRFVELTKMGNDRTWWRNAGRRNVQCDILLVSAHFGGDLFGDKNHIRLSLSELEEASCKNTHDGILKRPKEVFLFTCNMLAGKQRDVRTPRQYYQVLLEYYPPHIAQYYVQTRYGAWGGTFVARTLRAFYGVPRLYGYDSISPLGKDSGAWVHRYLASVGDYSRHLSRISLNTRNQTLIRSLGSTGMIQKSGVQPGTLGDQVRTNLCNYFNAGSPSGKLAVLARNLRRPKFEPYLTYVEEFYREHKPTSGAAHADIRDNTRVKNHVLRLIDISVDMPHTRIDLVNFASAVGWISTTKRKDYLEKIVRNLFSGATTADKVFDVCSVGTRHRSFVGKYVNLEFLESVKPSSQWDYRYLEMVGCLRPQQRTLQDKVASFLDPEKHQWKARWAAAYTFLDTKPETRYVEQMLVRATHDSNRAVRQTARQAAKNWKLKISVVAPGPPAPSSQPETRGPTAPANPHGANDDPLVPTAQ